MINTHKQAQMESALTQNSAESSNVFQRIQPTVIQKVILNNWNSV